MTPWLNIPVCRYKVGERVKQKEKVQRAGDPGKLLRNFCPPMLAILVDGLPRDEENWVYELKYDGFRAIAAVADGEVHVISRNGLDLASRFPSVARSLSAFRKGSAILDGEIVALDPDGVPRFELLQRGEGERTIFIVFDLLWLNGVDLANEPLESRRELLEKLLRRPPKGIELAGRIEGSPRAALESFARAGWEGLIAKRKGSKYETRRSKSWLKIKAINAQELAIVGYTPATNSDRQIGALLVAVAEDGELRFAGKVGTGFSTRQRAELMQVLSADAVPKPLVSDAPRMKKATWVRPRFVAQVRFTEWTADGKLRHPAFLGLRPDKKPMESKREKPAAVKPSPGKKRSSAKSASKKSAVPSVEVKVSSPDRLLYPRDGIVKQQVVEYYEAVKGPMLRALAGRPLALEHWNQGIDKPSWFHQNIGKEAEPWMTLVETPTRTSNRKVRHLVADRPETLRWLGQHSVLTTHMWSSRMENLESPDWLVFDLDPAKGKGIEQAVEAALVVRRLFEQLGLPSVPKTSGKRGIHLLVPLLPGYSHEDAIEFACTVSEKLAEKVDFMTTARPLAQRRGRLYLDCLQNGYGKTIVAPYSLRAADGAPVSAPLQWSEVTKKLDPSKFNLKTMPARLAKVGDLFRHALEGGVKLPRLR